MKVPWRRDNDTRPTLRLSYCSIHLKCEPIPDGGAYEICQRCGHVYPSAGALVDAYNATADRLSANGYSGTHHSIDAAHDIYFCQECGCDF